MQFVHLCAVKSYSMSSYFLCYISHLFFFCKAFAGHANQGKSNSKGPLNSPETVDVCFQSSWSDQLTCRILSHWFLIAYQKMSFAIFHGSNEFPLIPGRPLSKRNKDVKIKSRAKDKEGMDKEEEKAFDRLLLQSQICTYIIWIHFQPFVGNGLMHSVCRTWKQFSIRNHWKLRVQNIQCTANEYRWYASC